MSNSHDAEVLRVKRIDAAATLPTKGSAGAAGYDLYAARALVIPAGGHGVVPTGLAVLCLPGTYALIAPRSGLAARCAIGVGAGVVNADYRGPAAVILFSLGADPFLIARGDRIAQLIFERISSAPLEEVRGDLDATERSAAGFGSTGGSASV